MQQQKFSKERTAQATHYDTTQNLAEDITGVQKCKGEYEVDTNNQGLMTRMINRESLFGKYEMMWLVFGKTTCTPLVTETEKMKFWNHGLHWT